MASLLGGLRVGLRSRTVLQPVLLQSRRRVSQLSPQGNLNWMIAAGVGIAGITSYMYYRTNRRKPDTIGLNMSSQKTESYAKTGAVHPEAVAEKLISEEPPKTTPPATPTATPTPQTQETQPDLPSHVPYVLIGAGTASFAAAKAIREKNPQARVLIIGQEEYTPYSRPPLSKQLWLSEDHEAARELKFKASWAGGKVVDVFYKWPFCAPHELASQEDGGVAVLTGKTAIGLNPTSKTVTLEGGVLLTYDKCLLATGGHPRNLPVFEKGSPELKKHSSVYREIPDYLSLDSLATSVGSILVVGGGFLGSELAVGLANRGKSKGLKVIQLFPEEGNLGLVLPKDLTKWTTDKVRKEGVEVHPGTTIATATCEGGKVKVTTEDGKELEADHVVVAVGLMPNTQLARSARLETDPTLGGFRVNAELQACSNVWAAGDAACFFDPHLGRRRVEHHDHANVSGGLAGRNMAGEHERFTHQSMFWSDLGPEVGFEATGLIDSQLPTVGIWAKKTSQEESDLPVDDYSKGVVFYVGEERRIVGVLTWNLFGKMDLARQVIAEEKTEENIGEVAAKFEVHS